MSPVMYIAVRRDLDMPHGKMAAQVAHAALRLFISQKVGVEESVKLWHAYFDPQKGNETKIVLGVDGLVELGKLAQKCIDNGVPCVSVEDAGRTVFTEPTITCIAIGPVNEEQKKLFKRYRIY